MSDGERIRNQRIFIDLENRKCAKTSLIQQIFLLFRPFFNHNFLYLDPAKICHNYHEVSIHIRDAAGCKKFLNALENIKKAHNLLTIYYSLNL